MSDFTPAFPKPCKWSVGDNQYDQEGKNPKKLSVFIPLDSVHAFCNHLMTMADDQQLHKDGKVYNFQTKANESVKGIYLNCNGKDGDYGAYGNINPKKIAQELPF